MRYALLLGNSDFEDKTLSKLIAPKADVENLAAVLGDPEIGNFDDVDVELNSTSQQARRKIARFYANKKKDDLLLLYYTGHGVLDLRGNLYLAFRDTEKDLLRGTGIQSSFISEEMDSSRSKRQIMILDSCHSGAFVQGTKGPSERSVGVGSAFKGAGFGRVIMTASDTTQYAWEGEEILGDAKNSLYSHHLIEGIQNGAADLNLDGTITINELHEYVYDQVVESTPHQTPLKWAFKQQGDMVIARSEVPAIEITEAIPESTEDQPEGKKGLLAGRSLLEKGLAATAALILVLWGSFSLINNETPAPPGDAADLQEALNPGAEANVGQIVVAESVQEPAEASYTPVEIPGLASFPAISSENATQLEEVLTTEGYFVSAGELANGDQTLTVLKGADLVTYNLSTPGVLNVFDLDDWLVTDIHRVFTSPDHSMLAVVSFGTGNTPFWL